MLNFRLCWIGWMKHNWIGLDVFKYENVAGARSNALENHVPEEIKQDRWDRFMTKAQIISEAKLKSKVGIRS